jgi:sulfonate transport system substrate-binding protein
MAVALAAAIGAGLAACASSKSSDPSGSSSTAALQATTGSVPAGTVLKVAQQFDAEELPIKLSGTKAIPSTVSIDWSNFTGGPQIVQALEANAIDLGILGDVPVAYTQVANKGIVAVAAFRSSGETYGIVTAPGVSITSLAGLKGKKVAYTQATAPQGYLLQALKSARLSGADVDLVNIASQSDVTAALTSHSIDAAALTEPLITEYLIKNPTATKIAKSSPATTSGLTYFLTTEADLKNPVKVTAIADFLKAMVAANKWENANGPTWIQQYYVGEEQLTTALGQKVYNLTGPTSFPVIGPSVYAAQQKVVNVLAANGFLPTGLNAKGEFSTRFNTVIQQAAAGSS